MHIAWPLPLAPLVVEMSAEELDRYEKLYNAGAFNNRDERLKALWELSARIIIEERLYRCFGGRRRFRLERKWLSFLEEIEYDLLSQGYNVVYHDRSCSFNVSWSESYFLSVNSS